MNNVEVEYYEGDGSYGAAIGWVWHRCFLVQRKRKAASQPENIQPKDAGLYDELYLQWKHELHKHL